MSHPEIWGSSISALPQGEDKPSPLLWDAQVASETVHSRGDGLSSPWGRAEKLHPQGDGLSSPWGRAEKLHPQGDGLSSPWGKAEKLHPQNAG